MLDYVLEQLRVRGLEPASVGSEFHVDTAAGTFAISRAEDTSLLIRRRGTLETGQRCRDFAEVLAVLGLPRRANPEP